MEPLRTQEPDAQQSPALPIKPMPSSRYRDIGNKYDFRNHIVRKRWTWKLRDYGSNFWVWEASSCLLSLILLGVICYQLKKIDGNYLSVWKWPWEPTAVLAFSVTIMKASMMVPVASSLSQLKWHWFRGIKRLDGMEHFDEASRGMLGSLRLLIELKFWHLASLGAIITIGSLSIDTLAQNAVKIRTVPDHTYFSSIKATDTYRMTSVYTPREAPLPPRNLVANVNYALTTNGNLNDFQELLFSCGTENCIFPSYQSLAVDFKCTESTVDRRDGIVFHYALPNEEIRLDETKDLINSTIVLNYSESSEFADIGPLIVRWLILANPSTLNGSAIAMECAFYWTVKSYTSEVRNGTLHENVTSTWTNTTDRETEPHDIILRPPNCIRENSTMDSDGPIISGADICENYVSTRAHSSLPYMLGHPQFGIAGYASNDTESDDINEYYKYNNLFTQGLISNISHTNHTDIVDTINGTASRLAFALTVSVRVLPRFFNETYSYWENITYIGPFYGEFSGTTIWPPDVYYRISWGYMVIPIILVGLSAFFFAVSIFTTRSESKWKSSQLAVLFHGLGEQDVQTLGEVTSYADMREIGRDVHVRLVETDLGKKMVSRGTLMALD